MSETNIPNNRTQLTPDELNDAIDRAFASKPAAELAVLHFIERYQIDVNALLKKSSARGQEVAATHQEANYISMAPLVGLDPEQKMRDAPVISVFRACIPTSLFKEIPGDLHISLNQYGPAEDHQTEEARSRFLAPLINRIVAQFQLLIQNTPRHVLAGDISSKTFAYTVNRFKVFGAITIILIEDRFRSDSATDRLNAIAQVITEAAGVHPTISALLCDGCAFQFFSYNGSTSPAVFARGKAYACGDEVIDRVAIPSFSDCTYPIFVDMLHRLSKVKYGRFLHAYIAGLETRGQRLGSKGQDSCPITESALDLAKAALNDAIFAAELIITANVRRERTEAEEAFQQMLKSVNEAPNAYRRECCLVRGLDDDEYYG